MQQSEQKSPPQKAVLDKINRDLALQFMKLHIAELKKQQQKSTNNQSSKDEKH